MSVQSSYSVDRTIAYYGDIYDLSDCAKSSKISKFSGSIEFGIFCCKRAAESDGVEECGPPTATADVTARPRGFAVRNVQVKPGGYAQYEPVTLLTRGKIWVYSETAVTQDGAVFCRFTAEAPDLVLGTVRADADTDKAVAIPTAKFCMTTGAAGLVLVEINLP